MKNSMMREMVIIALPMMVSMACDTVMIFTDRVFLSRLSPELMNAAMGGGLTSFMMVSFVVGLVGYGTALTAQYLGAGRKDLAATVTMQGLIMVALAYFPILAARPLAYGFFDLMGVPAGQLVFQKTYFDILILGAAISLPRHVFSSFFSGIGRTGVVMGSAVTAMVVNIFASYVLIFGAWGFPALGIQGAAYGTLLGWLAGVLVLTAVFFGSRIRLEFNVRQSLRFVPDVFMRLWKFGSSTGLELFLNILAFNALVLVFHAHSPVAATAATIVINWDMVSFVPLIGIEVGVTSLVGRAMGAGDPVRAHHAAMAGIRLGLIFSTVIFILFVFFPSSLVSVFRPDVTTGIFSAAEPVAVAMIRAASLYVLVEAFFLALIGALRGAGDTRWAMGLSVSLHWMMTLTVWVALKIFTWSPVQAWLAVVVLFFAASWILWQRYQQGKWRSLRVVETPTILPVDGLAGHSD